MKLEDKEQSYVQELKAAFVFFIGVAFVGFGMGLILHFANILWPVKLGIALTALGHLIILFSRKSET